ncbi:hypothetical protein AFB00_25580 [Pseudonocardia sp. HH130630-07]|nr:hypothetical protein AFB00_25580 [Pseudonocardia sp. HH130630-07]
MTTAAAVLALVTGLGACSGAPAAPAPAPPAPTAVTTHDRVTGLIAEAKTAFDAPERDSTSAQTAQTEDNLQTVADRLTAAHALAPYRSDLLFSAASAQIGRGDVPAAVALYRRILERAPRDVDALSYLAGWTRHLCDTAGATAHLARLRELDPDRAADLDLMFRSIDRAAAPTDRLPDVPADGLVILTLGYKLNDDGTMAEALVGRLQKTLEAARRWPDAPVVVTGGVERAGRTEGESMKEWLVANGVAAERVHAEDFARTTLENAAYGVDLLAELDAARAVVVSSAGHVRRAQVIFELTAPGSLGSGFGFVTLAHPDEPLPALRAPDADELRSIYRDAFSALGLWAYRSAPLVQQ